jgi:hypothetical protein
MAELYTRYNQVMTYEGKPVSLHPLKFEEAVKELLKVKLEPRKPQRQEAQAGKIRLMDYFSQGGG